MLNFTPFVGLLKHFFLVETLDTMFLHLNTPNFRVRVRIEEKKIDIQVRTILYWNYFYTTACLLRSR